MTLDHKARAKVIGNKWGENADPNVGVYRDVSPVIYHQWKAASNTALGHLMRSAAHMLAYMKEAYMETPAQTIGRAVHAAVLEPDRFKVDYCAFPADLKRTTTEGKDVWAGMAEAYGEGNVLKHADYLTCLLLQKAVRKCTSAHGLLTGAGDCELSLVWIDPATGVKCKARWDRYSPQIAGGAIVDLKTTGDASIRSFERDIFKYGYHRKAAFYLRGAKVLETPVGHFGLIAAEKSPPYGVQCYRLFEGATTAGDEVIEALLKKYAKCEESGEYPGYPDEVRDITIPDYAWIQNDLMVSEIEATT